MPNNRSKIKVNGLEFDLDYFKPTPFEETEIPGILEALAEIGYIAKRSTYLDGLTKNSPLFYIEGLLRYQLHEQFFGKSGKLKNINSDYGLLDRLNEPSDFQHEKELIHAQVNDSKIVFLFDFLGDIVTLTHHPELIDACELDKLANNLRAFSFLVESQVTGSKNTKDVAFEFFIRECWLKAGSKKISAQDLWSMAISLLSKMDGEIEFSLVVKDQFGINKEYPFVVRLEEKNGKQSIKSYCENGRYPNGQSKSFNRIKNIWSATQKEFMGK